MINAFLGAMVGLERAILPLLGEREFGLASKAAILSFLITFGIVKAISNLLAGLLSDKIGRRSLLLIGWVANAGNKLSCCPGSESSKLYKRRWGIASISFRQRYFLLHQLEEQEPFQL